MREADPNGIGGDEAIRHVFSRLASLGLLSSPSDHLSHTPSLISSLLPTLLLHLNPPTSSPLPPYPPTYLSSLFLALPTSILTPLVSSFIQHLTFHLVAQGREIEPESSDERVKRAGEVFSLMFGNAVVGGEAWDGVIKFVKDAKGSVGGMDRREQARARLIVSWIGSGGEPGESGLVPHSRRELK